DGDKETRLFYLSNHASGRVGTAVLWATLMPWENVRAGRLLNLITQDALWWLDSVQRILSEQGKQRSNTLASAQKETQLRLVGRAGGHWQSRFEDWLATTNPDMSSVNRDNLEAASDLVEFEARKRGTMLVLAIEAYRLEHGKLPERLEDVMNA